MWKGLFPMTLLMVIVLGSIFAGWATATESAGVGVLGSFLIAALNGRLTLRMTNEAIRSACRANAMVFLIFLGATGFSYVFRALGGDDLMISTLAYFGIDTKWEMLAFVMVLIFLLGLPVRVDRDLPDRAADLRADPRQATTSPTISATRAICMAWFGTLVAVNLQTSFMTPPFGATLFYMKGTVPPGVTMTDVYHGMYPFVALQVIGLLLCICFPDIVLWLPRVDRAAGLTPGKRPTSRVQSWARPPASSRVVTTECPH